MRSCAPFLVILAWCLHATTVTAQPHPADTVRLSVQRAANATRCPDRDALRALLRARLERDPFDDASTRRATLRFSRTGALWIAQLRLDAPGRRPALRRLQSRSDDCARLSDAATLVLAIAIDPARALETPAAPQRPSAVPPATPHGQPATPHDPPTTPHAQPATPHAQPATPHAQPATPHGPPPTPHGPPPTEPSLRIAALAHITAGLAPGTFADTLRPGVTLRFEPRVGPLTLPVEFAVEAPGVFRDAVRRARVDVLPLLAGVGVCRRFGVRVTLHACATASMAAVLAWGDGYAPDASDVALAFALGARAGVEWPLSPRWRFVMSTDLRGLVVQPALRVNGYAGALLWSAPAIAVTLSLGIAWSNR